MLKHGTLTLIVTYLVALVLMVMPMPAAFDTFRPDWVTLVLLYWVLAIPHRVNMGTALILGVLSDILLGSPQQAILVAFLILLKRMIVFQANVFIHDAEFTASYFWPAFTSAVFWLWLFPLLRKIRRQFRVA